MASKFTIEQDEHGFKIMEDGLCYENSIATREEAEETIKEIQADDKQSDIVSAALDLAIAHIQANLPDLSVEEARQELAEMLRD